MSEAIMMQNDDTNVFCACLKSHQSPVPAIMQSVHQRFTHLCLFFEADSRGLNCGRGCRKSQWRCVQIPQILSATNDQHIWGGNRRSLPTSDYRNTSRRYPARYFFYMVRRRWETPVLYTLAHVCRRWPYIVSASPRRLRLQLCCIEKTRASEVLDAWLAVPIEIRHCHYLGPETLLDGADNIFAALREQRSRA